MQNLRTYGDEPFRVVVVHGGPGAPGEMAPVARELAGQWGVLEPLQTEASVAGQIDELRVVLEANAELPATLVGYSWGAWLSLLCAAHHPGLVRKLILVSSAPFAEEYAAGILMTRLSRLSEDEQRIVGSMMEAIKDPAVRDKDALLARFGALFARADACAPVTLEAEGLEVSWEIHQSVWKEAAQWRSSGKLLDFARKIRCPVVAIHGDCDPHPAEGVRAPLSGPVQDFRFILLDHCGHKPWIERQAAETFYD
ncbi:MAG: alpha/beta fold hydrolase, partial [Planctomycetota bacterium]